ncbi:MAG: hypothetical protein R3A13_10455 [Bdellovibrionota bacterium]
MNQSGFTIGKTTDDPTGYNGSNDTIAVLIDPSGNIVQQLNIAATGDNIYSAAISADGKTALIAYNNGANSYVDLIEFAGSFAQNPTAATVNNLYTGGTNDTIGMTVSDDGSHVAFIDSTTGQVNLFDTATRTVDATLQAASSTAQAVDFVDSNEVVILENGASNQDVEKFAYGDGGLTNIITNIQASTTGDRKFKAVENSGSNGYFILEDTGNSKFSIYSESGSEVGNQA